MAESALRTICLAYKKIENKENVESRDERQVRDIEKNNLTLLLICGIKDILREGVK